MNNRLTTLFLVAVCVVGAVITPTEADALTFAPERFVTEVYPGVPQTEELTLLNETGETVSVQLEPVLLDTQQATEGTARFLLDTAGSADVAWIAVSPDQLTIGPGETRSVDVTFTAPATSSGSLMAGIATTFRPVRSDETGNIGVIGVTGPLIFAENATGDIKKEGAITSLTTTGGSTWFTHLPISFEVSFANTSEVHLPTSVSLEVHDLFGRLTERIEMNEDQYIVLPHTSRTFTLPWDAKQSKERSSGFIGELVQPLIGPFTVTATVSDNASVVETAQVTVWFVPWRLMVLVGALLFLIVGARRRLRRV